MKKILVYKLEDTPYEAMLRDLAKEQNVLYIQVEKTELRNELRELLRIPAAGTDADAVFSPAPDVWIHRRDMVEPLLLLYGFTNDANGIRHAGDIGGPSSTFEEAKYMLVSCSAFVNYLIAIMSD